MKSTDATAAGQRLKLTGEELARALLRPAANGGRPKLLDLFCCAGGAAVGYWRAGFDVVGVDTTRSRTTRSRSYRRML